MADEDFYGKKWKCLEDFLAQEFGMNWNFMNEDDQGHVETTD